MMNKQQMPSWLTTTQYSDLPIPGSSWFRGDYLEKTLDDIGQVMAEDMYQDGIANQSGILQRIHPLLKIGGCILLLGLTAMTHSFWFLSGIHGITLFFVLLSGIRVLDYKKRVWIPAFIFSGITMLPATVNWITPGDVLLVIYQNLHWHIGPFSLPEQLVVTKQGVKAAGFVFMRTATSLLLIVAVVKTTRWTILTKSLRYLGMPIIFVMVLDLTYRYLFLFLLLLSDYIFGRKSRLVGREGPQSQWEWIGGAMAGFFRICLEYSEEVAGAMVARGYNGEYHQKLERSIGIADICFLGIIVSICILYGVQ
jgi:cobalt/nickel transport system permease protein